MRTAFVFPGQGSHRPGVLSAWQDHPAAAVVDELAEATGRDLVGLGDDPATGARTADAQPVILAASLVAWRALTDAGVTPDVVAGHSLGEVTAAVAAGALSLADGARTVAERGAAMGTACAATPGTMAAVVKLGVDAVEVLLERHDGVVMANDNAPGQVVVAGDPAAVRALKDPVRAAGGRLLPLDVEGAFHSPAMAPAVPPLAAVLARGEVGAPTVPLVSGTTAAPVTGAHEVVTALVDGVLAPVRWREVQLTLRELGITDLVEVGPGGVLAGLAKRAVPELAVHTVATPEQLAPVVDALAPIGVPA